MISKELKIVIKDAVQLASDKMHAYICIEHLLHAILNNRSGIQIIANLGGDIKVINKQIEEYFTTLELREKTEEPIQTLAFQRTLHRAFMHAQSAEKKEVDVQDVFVSLFEEKDSHALYFIQSQGIRKLDVLRYVSHGNLRELDDMEEQEPSEEDGGGPRIFGSPRDRKKKYLELYTEDWIDFARQNKFDSFIGRKYELERTIEILCRRVKNNPIHVGDPGVGKTAITQGLAMRIVDGKVPEKIRNLQIYSLDLGGMIAGTRFRGDFEERLKGVLNELKKKQDVVLYIDEIHTIVGAGATSGGSLNAANIIKPAISSGELRCIGSTTFEEFKNHFEKDRALSRRFQMIDVQEPDEETTVKILQGLQPAYESFHGVRYSEEAVKTAVALSGKFINDKKLPDKAIDVMDEAGAHTAIYFPEQKQVDVEDIEKIVAKIARIPLQSLNQVEKDNLKDLDVQLKKLIFNQDPAIERIVTAVKRNRVGLGHPDRPVGNFLFCGPTGVGKTELCRCLARLMGIELIRFDMSEYMEKHTVSRLIGAPAGYVGFEQGGLLTDAIRRAPNSVLLLDEIEKAHMDIYNILLQIMDHATLTDNTGRKADFRNVILIMTSNIGSREMSASSIGFFNVKDNKNLSPLKAIENHFAPEFRNRLDDIVVFSFLDEQTILKIVRKFIIELKDQLRPRKVELELTEGAENYLAMKGYDPDYGARPMARVIQEKVKTPLVDELLFGRLVDGGKVNIDCRDDGLVFSYT